MTSSRKPAPPKKLSNLRAVMANTILRLEARARGEERPIPLPWKHMAEQFGGGLWPGLHILVGGTGAGKTQFALQIALSSAKGGIPVLYISLELGELDIMSRVLGLETGRAWSDYFLGRGREPERSLAEAVERCMELQNLPLYFETGIPGAWSYAELGAAAARVREAHPEKRDRFGSRIQGSAPFLVILDFLQIVGDGAPELEGARSLELRERISRASYRAREIARDMDAAVLLLSSTSRANYAKTSGGALGEARLGYDAHGVGIIENPDALIGLGKESGDIEYAADTVTVLARWPERLHEEASIIAATAKQRPGVARWTELSFNGSRFAEPRDEGRALREALERSRAEASAAKQPKGYKRDGDC